MGKEYAKESAGTDSPKPAPRTSGGPDPVARVQQAGNQAVQTMARDTPAIDDYAIRDYGKAPGTPSGGASPYDMAGHHHRATPYDAAVADFLSRFPFLKPLTDAYKEKIAAILKQDLRDYRDLRKVDTYENELYLSPAQHPYSMPDNAYRLRALKHFEPASENMKRSEAISQDWILSTTPTEAPSLPLAESDAHTYLRETWQNIRKQPVYLAIDGWSNPALKLYISDGTFSWEVLSSARPVEMDDILAIDIIRRQYVVEETNGPKLVAVKGVIREATDGLNAAQHDADEQGWADFMAFPGVVAASKWRGKGAGFDAVVGAYTNTVYAEVIEKKRAEYQSTYLEDLGFLFLALGDALESLTPKDALSAQYLRELPEDERKNYLWKQFAAFYGMEHEIHRDLLNLTPDEWKAVREEANARAEKDWEQAPEVLPEKSQFNRIAEILVSANEYLDQGDLVGASIFATAALQGEAELAASVDRYITRVTTGAGRMVATLEHIKVASHLILTVLAPFGAAKLGINVLVGGAAIPAAFSLVSGVASGEGVGPSFFDAQKEFVTGLIIGRLTELVSARFVAGLGVSRPVADMLANAVASPLGPAGEILFRKMMDPKAPLPTLQEIEDEMWKSFIVGSILTMGTHAATAGRASADPAADANSPAKESPSEASTGAEKSTGGENKMSGTIRGSGRPSEAASDPAAPPDKFTKFNEEWTAEMRAHGLGKVNVLPAPAGPPLEFGVFERNIRTPEQAYESYNKALARAPDREVGIIRNIKTGEYLVQVGTKGSVGMRGLPGEFETVLHFHTNDQNILVYRLPSGADIELAQSASESLGKRPVTQFIEYPLPQGGRGRTAYTVHANGKVQIEFIRTGSGKPEVLEFSSPHEFQEYWNSRTRAVTKGSDDYIDLMNEAAERLGHHDVDPGVPRDNKMSGQYKSPFEGIEPYGYDSGMGIQKKPVTPGDVAREQELNDWRKKNDITKGPTQTPEVREFIWELTEISGGHPDPFAMYLARLRGTSRDMQFKEFIIPAIKKMMPPDSVFGTRDWAALERVLGIKELPWKHGAGIDLFLVNGKKIKPLDLTSKGAREQLHLAEKQDQAAELQNLLGPGWKVEPAEHFYHGAGAFNESTVIMELTPHLRLYGASIPAV